jgi:4'-phosphopantetheinyl transferase
VECHRHIERIGDNTPAPLVRIGCVLTADYSPAEMVRDASVLDDDERAAFDRFSFDADRWDYAAAHALLRTMLSEALPNVAPKDWRFVRTRWGRPLLTSPPTPWNRFSLSHGKGIVACAISQDAEVGIDVECADRRMDVELLAREVCSADEQAQLRAAAGEASEALFLDLWTLKEAYLKALGVGIASRPLHQISFDLRGERSIFTDLASEPPPWRFVLLRPTATSRVSVAVRSTAAPMIEAWLRAPGVCEPLQPIRTSYG